MDDTKQYKIQVKGTAYTFQPIPDEDVVRLQLIFNMNASPGKTIKAVTRIMRDSVGAAQWDELTDRFVEREISIEELIKPLKELLKRQTKDRAADPADE